MSDFLIAVGAVIVVALVVRAQFQRIVVYEWNAGLLYVDGAFQRTLAAGSHFIFRGFRKVDVITVRTSEQWLTTGAIDVTSAERMPFRMSSTTLYRVTNPHAYHLRAGQTVLQNALAAALVEVASSQPLEDLLANRTAAGERMIALVQPNVPECELIQVRVDTVQLPPETRRLFIEVEKARLEGLAALERARGEHAALRSLANAARLLKDNPELASLRLLQAVTNAKGATTIVLGQGAIASSGDVRPS